MIINSEKKEKRSYSGQTFCKFMIMSASKVIITIDGLSKCKIKIDSNNEGLNMKKTSLFYAANYLVHLYDKVSGEFASDPVKIQKLLFIALLYSFSHFGESFLDEDVEIEYCECGIKIRKIYDEIRNFISDGEKKDSTIVLPEIIDEIQKYKKSTIYGFDELHLPEEIRIILNNVFIRFGSYNSTTLGLLINELKAGISDGIFSLDIPIIFKASDIHELLDETKIENNEIMEYIQ